LAASVVLILAVILFGSTYLVNRIREADARHDITLHKIAYANKMASIGRMAAGVAHEINNPLAIINENAGLLKDLITMKGELPDSQRLLSIADTVLKSVARAGTITHRLLGFAKRMDATVEQIALGSLLQEVLSFQGREAEYRNITVNLVVPDELPIIESDRGQLQQVFLNILSNAFAAVSNGGQIDILVEQQAADTVTVIIRDNGPGIPEHALPHIFDPFFSTKGEHGTGLGLSITYGIVEKLGGRIEVRSRPDEGATFIVRLPVKSGS
jgi:signal transduction histidine kinase